MVNKLTLIGNTGSDLEMHFFDGGNCVGKTSLATTHKYKNRNGEIISETTWHNLIFRNKAAEIVEKYAKKGSKLYIEGRINNRSYEIEGQKRYITEVIVNEFTFLDSKNNESSSSASSSNQSASANNAPQYDKEDDLPF